MTGVKRTFEVPEGLDGERVDAGLARLLGLSRTKCADLVDAGLVLIDGRAVVKSERLEVSSLVEVELDEQPTSITEPDSQIPLPILFDDDQIVVVDKPVGIAAHSSPGWSGPTVLGQLSAHGYRISTSGAPERQGIVHRLDVGTSGVMVVAKSERAYMALKSAFKEREVEKIYHALVQGHPDPSRGTIDAPIGRHPTSDWRFAVVAGGKPSVTHYETLEAFAGASLLRIELETGRTHQIRVHFSALHHPCVGDMTYGADPSFAERLGLSRQWLHAVELSLRHPTTEEWMTFTSGYPTDLQNALDQLK